MPHGVDFSFLSGKATGQAADKKVDQVRHFVEEIKQVEFTSGSRVPSM